MKRLYKSNEKVISGVCGGLGVYFGVDPVLVRVLFIVFFLTALGIYPIIAYFIMSAIIPTDNNIIDGSN
ncbi:PspC domain-containing protein [uncultured Tyzzerella sp.]|uniref:PspC domain-containing protein n=1 Tax=uncultured Tyzzerella sp. TaxID=2321398 RepID=UPI002943BD58|nr:PspC domain-containing protein [uncultured Tyzzerella sp.]